jgi:hypothetical protein
MITENRENEARNIEQPTVLLPVLDETCWDNKVICSMCMVKLWQALSIVVESSNLHTGMNLTSEEQLLFGGVYHHRITHAIASAVAEDVNWSCQ